MSRDFREPNTASHAVCGAYLMVTYADGRHIALEEGRLLATLANAPAFEKISSADIEEAYNSLMNKFDQNYAATAADVLGAISAMKDNPEMVHSIKIAAQCATVADGALKPQEESAVDAIASALGLEKGSV